MNAYEIQDEIKSVLTHDMARSAFNSAVWSLSTKLNKVLKDAEKEQKKRLKRNVTTIADDVLTRDDLLAVLSKEAKKGNSQSAKLLSELQGYKKKDQDLSVRMVNFKTAPQWYKTEKPDGC